MRSLWIRLVAALVVASGCTAPIAVPAPSASRDRTAPATANATATASLTLHWMSMSLHSEPRYQLLYEGGSDGSFTQLRLIGPDGRIVAAADAVRRADQVLLLCGGRGGPGGYGALRAAVILATQELLADVIRRPDAYRVEVLSGGSWTPVGLVNECHGQE